MPDTWRDYKMGSVPIPILTRLIGARDPHSGSGQYRTFVTGDNKQPQHNHSPASGTSHSRKLTLWSHEKELEGDYEENAALLGLAAAATPSLTYDFAYMCLKNAESLLPASEQVLHSWHFFSTCIYHSQAAASGVFCEGVGYIGNPVTWAEVPSNYPEWYFGRMKTPHWEWAKDISYNGLNKLAFNVQGGKLEGGGFGSESVHSSCASWLYSCRSFCQRAAG